MTEQFSIMSFNTFVKGKCKRTTNFNGIIPNIICTQESADLLDLLDDGLKDRYDKILFIEGSGAGCVEAIRVFKKKDEHDKEIEPIVVSKAPPNEISNPRIFPKYGIIFSYKGIKIANLHLAGGKYFDKLFKDKFNDMLEFKLALLKDILEHKPDIILGDFNSVIPSFAWFAWFESLNEIPDYFTPADIYDLSSDYIKMDMYQIFLHSQYSYFVEKMFENTSWEFALITRTLLLMLQLCKKNNVQSHCIHDIISDFFQDDLYRQLLYSLLTEDLKILLETNIDSLKSKIIDIVKNFIKKVNRLNIEPYKSLYDSEYRYAMPDEGITNFQGKTVVDCIWYKPKTVSLVKGSCKIIKIMNDDFTFANLINKTCISDHNPVYAEFEIGPDTTYLYEQKYIKYKNKYLKLKYNLLH